MNHLLENSIEVLLLKNQELHEQAHRARDEPRVYSTTVARVMRQIIHERLVELEIDVSVMDLVNEKLSQSMEEIAQLPRQVICPALPASPLLLNFGQAYILIKEVQAEIPSFAGMLFQCPGDREVMQEARRRLPAKYHAAIEQVVGFKQPTWTLSCLDELGEEIVVYHYRPESVGVWRWSMYPGHQCPFGACRYSAAGLLTWSCDRCESVKALMTMTLGLILLYDSGYYQEVVDVSEEQAPRTYAINLEGKTTRESEVTRPVTTRRLRKNVLVKELTGQHPVVQPRGSWLAKYHPDEIVETRKVRRPYKTKTRSGTIIDVVPTKEKKIPRLRKNLPAHTVVELFAEPPL